MSGIEVAGLVLGAIPILLAVIDSSKHGMRRFEGLFNKRAVIKKLASALAMQKQLLEENVKFIVASSGCDDSPLLAHDPLPMPHNGILIQSSNAVKRVAKNIAGLAGSNKGESEDLSEIINANKATDAQKAGLFLRAKLVISMEDLKEAIAKLDDARNTLDRFVRVVVSNRQISENTSSRKATKLARALRSVRNLANSLSSAITKGWSGQCHSQHEARLLLEDRMDTAERVLGPAREADPDPILVFRLILTATVDQANTQWHETTVQVFGNNDASRHSGPDQQAKLPRVKIVVSETHSQQRLDMAFINDICGTIEAVDHEQRRLALVLTRDRGLGAIPALEGSLITYHQAEVVTLKQLLYRQNLGPALPLKFRMTLALRLASNLLQLSRTPWLAEAWSKDTVCFGNRHAGSGVENSFQNQGQVDLSRPCVSLSLDEKPKQDTRSNIKPRMALLELGILLLEIWHESPLETQFPLSVGSCDYYRRLALAAEWLDDTRDPLPDLYEQAVSYCIQQGTNSGMYNRDWDEMKILDNFCEEVIQPLYKNCKQWR
ncbi:MAG: hypothetical protein Q9160_008318 [Pyrenula sp. 1 TL-2023]